MTDNNKKYTSLQIARMLGSKYAPTSEQVKIIEAPLDGALLVIAGAGAGKTEVMSSKILYMTLNNLVLPNEILALTFANKAKQELEDRIRARLSKVRRATSDEINYFDEEFLFPHVATYNSFASNIVRNYGYKIGLSPLARLINDAEIMQILNAIVNGWQNDFESDMPISQIPQNVYYIYQKISEHDLEIEDVEKYFNDLAISINNNSSSKGKPKITAEIKNIVDKIQNRKYILPFVQAYMQYKKNYNLLDFADQIRYACKIVSDFPEVVEQLRNKYKVVLLDEYQDTSVSQIQLLSTIFKDHNVVAVGDPKQAIYGWRGASLGAVEDFAKKFADKNSVRFMSLSISWRNSSRILDYANVISQPLQYEFHDDFKMPILRSKPNAPVGQIHVINGIDPQDSFENIAKYVKEYKRSEQTLAIICRRKSSFLAIQKELTKQGIKSQKIGLDGLLMQKVIRDLLAFLKISIDSQNAKYLIRIFDNLNIGVNDMHVFYQWSQYLSEKLTGSRGNLSIIDCLEMLPEVGWHEKNDSSEHGISDLAIERMIYIRDCLRNIRNNFNNSIEWQLKNVINICGLETQVQVTDDEEQYQALNTIVELARDFENNREFSEFESMLNDENMKLKAFLDWLDMVDQVNEKIDIFTPKADSDTVQIMTIHAAKGLEWDIVVVPEMVECVFPSFNNSKLFQKFGSEKIDPRQTKYSVSGWLTDMSDLPYALRKDKDYLPDFDLLQYCQEETSSNYIKEYKKQIGDYYLLEEARLAYVAFTRAKQTLVLSSFYYNTNSQNRRVQSRYIFTALNECKTITEPLEKYFIPYEQIQENTISRNTLSYWPRLDYEKFLRDTLNNTVLKENNKDLNENGIFSNNFVNANTDIVNEIDVLANVDWRRYEFPNNYSFLKKYADYSLEDLEKEVEDEFGKNSIDASKISIGDVSRETSDFGKDRNTFVKESFDDYSNIFNDKRKAISLIDEIKILLEEKNRSLDNEEYKLPNKIATTSVISRFANKEDYIKNIKRPVPKKPSDRARLGVLFHEWVQLHEWDNDILFTLEQVGEGPEITDFEKKLLSKWKNNFLNLELVKKCEFLEQEDQYELPIEYEEKIDLEMRNFDKLSDKDCFEENAEKSLEKFSSQKCVMKKEMLICRIDAVLKDEEGNYIVVDWKTGRVPVGAERELLGIQLGIYRIVWAMNNNIELSKVKACFVYVDSNIILYLEDVFDGDFNYEYLQKILSAGKII